MEPITLALIVGGAMLLTGGKKKPKREPTPPTCPAGFVWSAEEVMCVPLLTDDQPPQIQVIGDCEVVRMLPSPAAYITGYVQPKLVSFIEGMGAQPHGGDPSIVVGADGTEMTAVQMLSAVLAVSPMAFATDQFPTLGALCHIPTAVDDTTPTPAVWELFNILLEVVQPAVINFNQTGEIAFPQIEG
jgi:hypothetical protein